MNKVEKDIDKLTKFDADNEEQIEKIRESVVAKASYDLRQIISIGEKVKVMVGTGEYNEYGDEIEDWSKVPTKKLLDIYSEASSWCFYSSPVKLKAFIESSLAEIVYKEDYNTSFFEATGTVANKTAETELKTLESKFVLTYRNLYTNYVTETLRSFDGYVRRLERIIDWRLQEERFSTN